MLTVRMNWDEAKRSFLKLLLLCACRFLPLSDGSVAAARSKHTALIGIGHLDYPKGSKINIHVTHREVLGRISEQFCYECNFHDAKLVAKGFPYLLAALALCIFSANTAEISVGRCIIIIELDKSASLIFSSMLYSNLLRKLGRCPQARVQKAI